MMTESVNYLRKWHGARPCLMVLSSLAITLAVMIGVAFRIGLNSEDSKAFLKPYRAPDISEALVGASIEYCMSSSEANDVVFAGDSTCSMGVRPNGFQEGSGLSAYNIGAAAGVAMDGILVLMQHYLEHHPKPRIVVLCLHPKVLGIPFSTHQPKGMHERFLRSYGNQPPEVETVNQRDFAGNVREGICIALGRMMGGQTYYAHQPILRWPSTYAILGENLREQRGFFEVKKTLSQDAVAGMAAETPYSVLPDFREGIRAFGLLLRRHHIKFMLRLTPVLAGHVPLESRGLSEWLKEFEDEFPEATVGKPELLPQSPNCFVDEAHCNSRGATEFTNRLAIEVVAALGEKSVESPLSIRK